MSSSPYRRPPITEAVVELRLADPIDVGQVDNFQSIQRAHCCSRDLVLVVEIIRRSIAAGAC